MLQTKFMTSGTKNLVVVNVFYIFLSYITLLPYSHVLHSDCELMFLIYCSIFFNVFFCFSFILSTRVAIYTSLFYHVTHSDTQKIGVYAFFVADILLKMNRKPENT